MLKRVVGRGGADHHANRASGPIWKMACDGGPT
jgi:hypothetical protein